MVRQVSRSHAQRLTPGTNRHRFDSWSTDPLLSSFAMKGTTSLIGDSDLQVASRPRTAVPCWWPALRYQHSRQTTTTISKLLPAGGAQNSAGYCRWPNLQRCWIETVEQFTAHRLSMFFVENSNISILICLSLDIVCLFVSLTWTLRFLFRLR